MATDNTDFKKGHRARVREKFARLNSFDSFEAYEVLELLLFYSIPRRDTKPIAKNLINAFGSLSGVLNADIKALEKQPGVGKSTALFLHAIKNASAFCSLESAEQIKGAGDLGAFAVNLMRDKTIEEFYVLTLNSKNEITNKACLATGGFSSVSVTNRAIMDFAINNQADRIALIHNHTNGILVPSKEDLEMTKKLIDVAKCLDITVVDHIIVAGNKYTSIASLNTLKMR